MPKHELDRDVITADEIEIKRPRMYRVLLLNDDYTTMEFVVQILETVFKKPHHEAQHIMLAVHQEGYGTAGIYTKEIAETKIEIVHHLARQNEFPLKCKMEPV